MIARRIYRILLCLHPPAFRQRFADEMLWIFDQAAKEGSIWRLLSDAALSLLRQHLAEDTVPRYAGKLFQEAHADSLHAIRLFQASAIALPLFVGFILLVHEAVPLPEPPKSFAVRTYRPDVCGQFVRASERSRRLRVASSEQRSRP